MNTLQYIKDTKGRTLIAVPIDDYNELMDIAERYISTEIDDLTPEEIEIIELSKKEAKEGKTISSEELFANLRKKYAI